ncbi:MAG: helix-turn-helix transcriptional regulator [Desulfobacterales bacterium]|jgi:transcriptional regulator with XRE-family HTH domain|nr:helix-turn-helix transcriptional regulator [Desulfobacterales bacterium]
MILETGELIAILRNRAGLTQQQLGESVFGDAVANPNVKVKKIEKGQQAPTPDELKKMASIFKVKVNELTPTETDATFILDNNLFEMFPEIRAYLQMLNEAAKANEKAIAASIITRIAEIINDKK